VFAEFERSIIRERVAGAKAEGIALGRSALEDPTPAR
jgi:DNA invertase Pin-like site-specific DNA recombinase